MDLMIERLGKKKYNALMKKANGLMPKRDAIIELMKWIEPHLAKLNSKKKRSAMVNNELGQSYFD